VKLSFSLIFTIGFSTNFKLKEYNKQMQCAFLLVLFFSAIFIYLINLIVHIASVFVFY